MNAASQEIGPILVVFLQLQVGVNQALEHFIPIGAQGSGGRSARRWDHIAQECRECGSSDGFQQNGGIGMWNSLAEFIQIVTIHQKDVFGWRRGSTPGDHQAWAIVPDAEIGIGYFGHADREIPNRCIQFPNDLLTKFAEIQVLRSQLNLHFPQISNTGLETDRQRGEFMRLFPFFGQIW